MIWESLHDGIAQELTGIRMMSRSLANNLEKMELTDAAEKARRIEEAVIQADQQARQLAHEIVPVELAEGGLDSALEQFENDMRELHGVEVTLEIDGLTEIPPEVATQTFRITQEAALNAAMHGACKTISVRIEVADEEVHLQIEDDGSGLSGEITEMKQEGMGIRIMQYRAHLLGGQLDVEESEAGGVLVTCRLPIDSPGEPEP
jgi:signal transduction histidine kinase